MYPMQLSMPFTENVSAVSDKNVASDMKVKKRGPGSKLAANSVRLPTNTLSTGSRIQRWANFIAGFSIEFVEQCLAHRDTQSDIVLEPFLWCGTTLVGAKNKGFRDIGVEAHLGWSSKNGQ